MASLIRKRRRGNTTRTTTTKPNKTITTVSKGTTSKTGAGSHRVTHTMKWDGGSSSAYVTETHRNSSGYTRTTRKMGEHKKPGRKSKFKGSPTRKSRATRQKGFDVDLDLAQSVGLIFLCLILLGFIMFTEFMILILAIIFVVWIVHKAAGEEKAEQNGEEQ